MLVLSFLFPSKRFFSFGLLLLCCLCCPSSLLAQSYTFINNDVGAPNLFEACKKSSVTIHYTGFSAHPIDISLLDRSGTRFFVNPINFSNQTNTNGNRSGTIDFNIPDSAVTSFLIFVRNGVALDTSDQPLVIHNPFIDFLPQAQPLCATDSTVELYGYPSGGIFSDVSTPPNNSLISGSTLYPAQAGWSNQHDTAITFDIQYSYFAKYTDGSSCKDSNSITKPITIYDNRINSLAFAPLVRENNNPAANTRLLTLDSSWNTLISQIEPNLLYNGTPAYTFNFSGTFVDAQNNFLGDISNTSNRVTLEFNNHGCVGSITSNLEVYEPLVIDNLPDTLCNQAQPIDFFRDPNLAYFDTVINSSNLLITITENKVIGASTANPSHQAALTFVNSTGGQEHFRFDPNFLPNFTRQVVITMFYENKTTLFDGTNLYTQADTFQALDTIVLLPRPTLSLGAVSPSYCSNAQPDTIAAFPAFESPSRTYFQLRLDDSLGLFSIVDRLDQDSILNPQRHYLLAAPQQNRDLNAQLSYTVNRFGCISQTITNFVIRAPLQPFVLVKPAYCKNEDPSLLQASILPGGVQRIGTGEFLSAVGLDTVTGTFSPRQAALGATPFTYVLTDPFGCAYPYQDTLIVRQPPRVEMTLNGSRTTTSFCANATNVAMRSRLIVGTAVDSVQYFGAGVMDSILHPSIVFPMGGGGTSPVWTVVTDTFGCKGYDSILVQVIPTPSVDIDSLFNRRRTNYGANSISDHTYCKSEAAFVINGNPLYRSHGVVRGSITGRGVSLSDTTYSYNPALVPVGIGVDTVVYTYRDSIGCTNTDWAIIKLDSVPIVELTGFPTTNFCPNYDTVQLLGTPNTSSAAGQGVYQGQGINPNTGLFTPALAGLGSKAITYTFTDQEQCRSTDTVWIQVNPLPSPAFGGYAYQYCTAAPADTLHPLNDTTNGSFHFYGNLILDSIGILQPDTNYTGPQSIYYAYTDSNHCTNIDSVNVFIHPTPVIKLYGLDSAYCHQASDDIVTVVPAGGGFIYSDTTFSSGVNTIIVSPNRGSTGTKTFSYTYTDNNGCSDTLSARTYIYHPPTPLIHNLAALYCENRDTVRVVGSPARGTFSGSGIGLDSNWYFVPARAGAGSHAIIYTIRDSLQHYMLANGQAATLVCPADTTVLVVVKPLPVPRILSPSNNSRFCSTDSLQVLEHNNFAATTWHHFTSPSNGVNFVKRDVFDTIGYNPLNIIVLSDTSYYFDPSVVGEGTHFVTYTATDSASGCQDSVQYTYIVDDYTIPFFSIDSMYCESADSVLLYGVPSGGVFARNGHPIVGNPVGSAPYFHPNRGYSIGQFLSSRLRDTLTYTFVDGACEGVDTQLITIHPVPPISFSSPNPAKVYCLGQAPVPLFPTVVGGSFTGTGVRPNTAFFDANLAEAGIHPITLKYTDSTTGCFSQYVDTFFVYGVPRLDFAVAGGCQYDSIQFIPNNSLLHLNNLFQNNYVDSVTGVWWQVEDTVVVWDGTGKRDSIAPLVYAYENAGVYQVQLKVANQDYCIDSQTIRIVISPRVSTYPYVQDFENGSGQWFAESRDSSYRLLWEWGIDSTIGGAVANNPNSSTNHLWSTQNNATYEGREQAWVYGPCFDLSSLERPMISLDYWSDVRDSDGSVLEYQKADGSWVPLGAIGRGINWFDDPFLTAQPGNQIQAPVDPIGWGSNTLGWKNGRYKLDKLTPRNGLTRLRIAFAAVDIPLDKNVDDFYDGFAFDNVVIKNRNRKVLLETFANIGYPNMELVNDSSYQWIYHTPLNKDVVLLQYHMESPNPNDLFYTHNEALGRNRAYIYAASAGQALINGKGLGNASLTLDLKAIDFEQDMLEEAKFAITIDTFFHANGHFQIRATTTALMDIDSARFRIYTVVSEDSLYYPNGSGYNHPIHAVARENDQYHSNPAVNTTHVFNTNWTAGQTQTVTFHWNHAAQGFINYRPNCFHAVVFIQDIDTKEIFQVATTRDVSGYWIGIEPIEAEEELNELQSLNLFPNPAQDYFQLQFDQALQQPYHWALINIQGITLQQGTVAAGIDQLLVEQLPYPSGTYLLLLYNDKVFVQRKVVLSKP